MDYDSLITEISYSNRKKIEKVILLLIRSVQSRKTGKIIVNISQGGIGGLDLHESLNYLLKEE